MMPKSTATRRPSASTNRLPGCMSAWKKPSRMAWRRKDWMTVRPSADPVVAGGLDGREVVEADAVDPFDRQHVAGGEVPFRLRHAEIRVVLGVLGELGHRRRLEAQVHLDGDGAGQGLDDLQGLQAPRLGHQALEQAGGGAHRLQIAGEAPRARRAAPPSPRRPRAPSAVARRAWWTWAIEAAATGSPNSAKSSSMGRPRAASTDRAPPPRAGRAACGPAAASRSRAAGDADDVGPGRQELAELDVGRPEPRQRRREAGGAVAGIAPLDQSGEAQAEARRRRQHARIDEARARPRAPGRSRPAGCARDGRCRRSRQSFQPEWIATMPPVKRPVR